MNLLSLPTSNCFIALMTPIGNNKNCVMPDEGLLTKMSEHELKKRRESSSMQKVLDCVLHLALPLLIFGNAEISLGYFEDYEIYKCWGCVKKFVCEIFHFGHTPPSCWCLQWESSKSVVMTVEEKPWDKKLCENFEQPCTLELKSTHKTAKFKFNPIHKSTK